MRYYISDLHFYHGSLNELMDKRGFESTEAMNEYMINKWNAKVRRGDEVVILGDFSWGTAEQTNDILSRLNGKKYLIIGNHDRFIRDKNFDTKHFLWAEHYKEIKDNKRKVILSHYPVFCYNGQYRLNEKGDPKTYMLYGHVHNTFDEYLINDFVSRTKSYTRLGIDGNYREIPCNMINCFCMYSDYTPLTLDEWIALDKERRSKMDIKEMAETGQIQL